MADQASTTRPPEGYGMSEMTDYVLYERRGAMALITLNRPDVLNAFTAEMVVAIRDAARRAERDPEVFALAITGTGRAFCAGFDGAALDEVMNDPSREPETIMEGETPALFSFLQDISKPVIAAVNGVAAGGGLVLAMMCDLRFASTASSFTTVFARRGLIAECGIAWLLPRLIGLSRALDLLVSSRRVSGDEAYRLGLADRLISPDDLLDEVATYVDAYATTVSPGSAAVAKAQVYQGLSEDFAAAADRANRLKLESFKHPDALEGAQSFLEKRPPRFAPWSRSV
jgi:enoyl-CoA hydratase/carnithine racemase